MKRAIATLAAVAILLAMPVPAWAQTIKLATLAPQGSPWYEAIRDMAEAWKEATGGKINLRIYAAGVAGDEPDVVRKMRIGQLHAAALAGGGLPDITWEIRTLQMPMMFGSEEELDYVRSRIGPRLEAIMEAKGFKVLYWGDAGWLHFFTKQPVIHPDDLKSLRLFSWSGETCYIEAWKDAGYHPVPLAATDIHTALQSGLIEAIAVPPIAALSLQWFGLAKHMTDLKWVRLVGAMVISTRTWEAIPDDIKPALLEAAREAGARTQEAVRRLGDEAVEVMKKHGLAVHHVPPEVVVEWEGSARAGYPSLVGKCVPSELFAEVERLRNEYRASQKAQ